MGTCKLCGQDAGFLRGVHKECQAKHDNGVTQIVELITSRATRDAASQVKTEIGQISQASFIQTEELVAAEIKGWQGAVTKSLEDDILTIEEEKSLATLKEELSLDQEALDSDGSFLKLVKAAVLRDFYQFVGHAVVRLGAIEIELH